MKWPLGPVAAWLVAGIFVGGCLPLLPIPLPWLLAATLLGAVAALSPWRGATVALPTSILLLGWTSLVAATSPLSPHDLRRLASGTEELATLQGHLAASPELRRHERAGKPYTNVMAILVCDTFERPGEAPRRATGQVLVSTLFPPGPGYVRGSRIEVTGVLRPPRGPLAPGLFDFAAYLHWRGIEHELRLAEPGDWRTPPGTPEVDPPWDESFQAWARKTLVRGLSASEEEVQLLWAMTLGWKTGMSDEVQEAFMRSGTMHVFAISGLHIALIAGILSQVLRLLLVPRSVTSWLVIGLCWAYTVATGLQPSAVRSTLMTTFVVGGWMLARPSNLLNSLAAAAVAVLIWDPRQLFQAGFQLSFTVVAALGLLANPLRDRIARPFEPDPLLPAELVPRWRRRAAEAGRGLAGHVAVSAASWVGSLPLVAQLFHLATPGSLLANLVVVPLSSLALACNLASLACGSWATTAGEWFNHSAWFWMHGMIATSRWVAGLPGSCWNVASPPLAWLAAWYTALLATGLHGWARPRLRRILLPTLAALAITGYVEIRWRHSPVRVVVLPLGAGHSLWVEHPDGSSLVDTGDASASDSVVRPFLVALGRNHLDQLVLTHGDVRHVGGATQVMARFPARELLYNPLRFRSPAYRSAVDAREAPPPDRRRALVLGTNSPPWRVLHPARGDAFPRADDACLALALDQAGTRIIALADLDRRGQTLLLERNANLAADVLILAPPSTGNPVLSTLLERVRPRWVVVADAQAPATAQAKPEFRRALAEGPYRVLYTHETGGLDLRWDGKTWQVRDARGRKIPETENSSTVPRSASEPATTIVDPARTDEDRSASPGVDRAKFESTR